jgi:hypothetical protein
MDSQLQILFFYVSRQLERAFVCEVTHGLILRWEFCYCFHVPNNDRTSVCCSHNVSIIASLVSLSYSSFARAFLTFFLNRASSLSERCPAAFLKTQTRI